MTLLYAHSGNGFLPQPYETHVKNVFEGAISRANRVLSRSSLSEKQKQFFVDCVSISSIFHDLGKLDETSQIILSAKTPLKNVRMLNHVDAGIAFCLNKYIETKNLVFLVSSWLISAHHIGFRNFEELAKQRPAGLFGGIVFELTETALRDNRNLEQTYNILSENETVKEYVDQKLPEYMEKHFGSSNITYNVITNEQKSLPVNFFDIRMMLSCLVDADHQDTSNFYSPNESVFIPSYLEPENRLELLKNHIQNLPKKGSKQRQQMRDLLCYLAFNGEIVNDTNFHCMDGPVGSGKTYAELAFCLRIAEMFDCDRIDTVLPFINVIKQTIERYKEAILFDGESPDNINPIHSKCEFQNFLLRKYSRLWNYPFNITTAVQFFESLCSNHPASLRKLHTFANSVINLDEFHQMTEHGYWKYNLYLFEQLSRYNTHFLFGSGTSVYYWEPDLFNFSKKVHQVVDGKNYKLLQKAEKQRVKRITLKKPFEQIEDFCEFVLKGKVNTKLVVLNTVRNALLVARIMKEMTKKYNVFHLSTCLNQRDKEKILEKIKKLLDEKQKVILVATSIIECGVDISFQVGYREKIGLLQREQFGGRICRNEEFKNSKTYVFEFAEELKGRNGILTENPANENAIQVFDSLPVKQLTPEFCSQAVKLELENVEEKIDFLKLEKDGKIETISEEYKVIGNATCCILTDMIVVERMKKNEYISPNEIAMTTVQVWLNKLDVFLELGCVTKLSEILENNIIADGQDNKFFNEGDNDYYVWNKEYDPKFYGIGKYLI